MAGGTVGPGGVYSGSVEECVQRAGISRYLSSDCGEGVACAGFPNEKTSPSGVGECASAACLRPSVPLLSVTYLKLTLLFAMDHVRGPCGWVVSGLGENG